MTVGALRVAAASALARTLALATVVGLAVLVAGPCGAQESFEPPPEAAEGADWVAEPADTVDDASVEWGLGATGQPGAGPRRRRRMSFRADSVSGALRTGDDDPLAGGRLSGRAWGGELAYGRLAPRWGRGLVLGAPAEPWSVRPADRGVGAAFRGRSGDGLAWRRAGAVGVESFAGRFGARPLAGLALSRGAVEAGVIGARDARPQASVSATGGSAEAELVADTRGVWRAETAVRRDRGPATVLVRARVGQATFRSLAEPSRSGPARAATVGVTLRSGAARVSGVVAVWRFGADAGGSRGAIEASAPAGASVVQAGLEEQRGVRRLPGAGATARDGLRQGLWCEWRGRAAPVELGLRQETWGRRALAREVVRQVVAARAEVALGLGVTARVTHTVYRVRRGESLYLPEADGDRLVVRALSGAGERTRAELSLPAVGGRVRGALALSRGATSRREQWSLDWTRRVRLRR